MKALLLVLAFSARAFAEDHRPFSEMHGGCENFRMAIAKDLAQWVKPAEKLAPDSAAPVSPGKKIELGPLEEGAAFAVKPEKEFRKGKVSFAGSVSLRVPEAGVYRVSLGGKILLDVVDRAAGNALAAERFEMQTKCPKIFKAVEYRLEKDKDYLLQVSSSASKSAELLVSKVE